MSNTANSSEATITEGSGDVFADLGFPDPGLARAKAELALQIQETIRRRGWTQTRAAAVMGIDQPKVSAIVRGRLSAFSLDRLVTYLDRLGRTVQFRFGAKSTSKPTRDSAKVVGSEGATRRKVGRGRTAKKATARN